MYEDQYVILSQGHQIPCVWERGGGLSDTGSVTLVTGPKGEPKSGLYFRSGFGDHALVPVVPGDYVLHIYRYHDSCFVWVNLIYKDEAVKSKVVALYGAEVMSEFNYQLPEEYAFLQKALLAGFQKSLVDHCRNAVWAVDNRPRLFEAKGSQAKVS
jgi:hypothetical protein